MRSRSSRGKFSTRWSSVVSWVVHNSTSPGGDRRNGMWTVFAGVGAASLGIVYVVFMLSSEVSCPQS